MKTVRILAVVLVFIRGSQTQDLASVSSVRTTEFEVRNLNTVVRFHHTSVSKFIKTQVIPYHTYLKLAKKNKVIPYLPKVGKFVLSTTQNYWKEIRYPKPIREKAR